ncbi:MAG: UDP-N-acetylglucosamine 2-epimerase (non-hydrolyzing) [Thermodesulfobacteriota bacterium]
MKLLLVAGARPNFMKIAPLVRALAARHGRGGNGQTSWRLVHTGQHYDWQMSGVFFAELGIPVPDHFLEVGAGSHAVQTGAIMAACEKVCQKEEPDLVVVVGDVNSTLAASLAAKKLGIRVAHVEAGLRSFDRTMPEEINRLVTDAIADQLFVTEESARENLLREGKDPRAIHLVGHVMVDNLFHQLALLELAPPLQILDIKRQLGSYAFLTLHRPANVDDAATLTGIAAAVNAIAEELPVVFPVHPRTSQAIARLGLTFHPGVRQLPPLSFREALTLWADAVVVLTDSGGLQEETTALGVPCLTLRENTERPVTITTGTNRLAGTSRDSILAAFARFQHSPPLPARRPPLWDGRAARRIIDILSEQPCPCPQPHDGQQAQAFTPCCP